MSELNLNVKAPQPVIENQAPAEPIPVVTDDILKLQTYLNKLDSMKIKGKELMMNYAREAGIDLSYASILRKQKLYRKYGIYSLKRKEKSDKGELKSFSDEVLVKLKEIFTDKIRGGCAVRAYEDAHKFFRSISHKFVELSTGEELEIHNGYLCDVQNRQILSQYSTKYTAGIYKILPQYVKDAECELSIGTYRSASRYLKGIKDNNADALFLRRYGIHDFRNKRQHAMKLDYANLEPNDLWTGDGKLLDIIVISEDWRKVYRPWLVGWVDNATRRYCYVLVMIENSETIANSLAQAINQWGIPKKVCHDNGAGYLSGRFHQMKEHFNIPTRLATVKLARAKLVESIHNIIDNLLKTQIGYTGNKREEFPQDTRDRLKLVLGLQKDAARVEKEFKNSRATENFVLSLSNSADARLKHSKKRFMHISELEVLLEKKFEEYHERVQGGLKKDKLGNKVYDVTCDDETILRYKDHERLNTPFGRYDYKVETGFIPVRADAAAVAMYALNYEIRTIQLTKGITLNNEEFYSSKLSKYAGEKVLVRYINSTTDKVYVFHSPELQKIGSDKKLVTNEINSGLKFVCIAKRQTAIDYNDESFIGKIYEQRAEEKKLKDMFRENAPVNSNIHSLTGIEKELAAISAAETELELHKKPKTILKRLNDD